jgi:hypothetical protein
MVGKPPFADLDDGLVQENFEQGIYPQEIKSMPSNIAISVLAFWSKEFAQQINQQVPQEGKQIEPHSSFSHTPRATVLIRKLQHPPRTRLPFLKGWSHT